MRLLLVRHATPLSKHDNPEQPLSDYGFREIENSSLAAANMGMEKIKTVFHSGKARARQTAEILAKRLGSEDAVQESDGLLPMDSPLTWLTRLMEHHDDLALVGHMPYMENLATALLTSKAKPVKIEFDTATIACLERDENLKWNLDWIIKPELY